MVSTDAAFCLGFTFSTLLRTLDLVQLSLQQRRLIYHYTPRMGLALDHLVASVSLGLVYYFMVLYGPPPLHQFVLLATPATPIQHSTG